MALKDTVTHLHELLHGVAKDLERAVRGNKAASQRVRTGTIKLEKVAKAYRKESIAFEKGNKGKKKVAIKTGAAKKAAPKKAAAKAPKKAAAKKAAPKKAVHHKKAAPKKAAPKAKKKGKK